MRVGVTGAIPAQLQLAVLVRVSFQCLPTRHGFGELFLKSRTFDVVLFNFDGEVAPA